MQAIPQAYQFDAAVALIAIGLTALLFGVATVIDTRRGRAGPGDACTAFGIVCCAAAAHLLGRSDTALPILGALALVRMVLAVAAAIHRRKDERVEDEPVRRRTIGEPPTQAEDPDEITVRLETPIDEGDLFRRPDRPRAAMDAVVRQLGGGASVVALRVRRGTLPGAEKHQPDRN